MPGVPTIAKSISPISISRSQHCALIGCSLCNYIAFDMSGNWWHWNPSGLKKNLSEFFARLNYTTDTISKQRYLTKPMRNSLLRDFSERKRFKKYARRNAMLMPQRTTMISCRDILPFVSSERKEKKSGKRPSTVASSSFRVYLPLSLTSLNEHIFLRKSEIVPPRCK